MTQEDWTKMNKESHYRALQEQDTENRKLIKKLQLERDALKKQLLISGVSCSSDGCYECGSYNLRPKEYNCLDCGHDGYCY